MRYARILNAVLNTPWMITPAAHAAIVALLQSKIAEKINPLMVSPAEPIDAQRVGYRGESLPSMIIRGDTAYIPVYGVLGNRLAPIEKSCGATDYADVGKDLVEAEQNDQVKKIVFDIDSPGGAVAGLAGLATRMRLSKKRTLAFVSGECASAALYLAVACNGGVYAERGALVGSVGTIIPFVDSSMAYAKEGFKVQLITSTQSPLKGAGWPGTSLTPEQQSYFQALVDEMDADFRGFVKAQRPGVREEALRGNMYSAQAAKAWGVVDNIVNSISEL